MSKFFPLLAICLFSLLIFVSLNVQTASAGLTFRGVVGGVAEGHKKVSWCCSMHSDICEPCFNTRNEYAYMSPSPCDPIALYLDLTVRCMDPTCNNLTKGDYQINICRLGSTGFPTPLTQSDFDCTAGACLIDKDNNTCTESSGKNIFQQFPVFIQIVPSTDPSPNAPFFGLWSAVVLNCGVGAG